MARHTNFEEWRKKVAEERRRDDEAYEYLDAMSRRLEIDDLPFRLEPRHWEPNLHWMEIGRTLQQFAEMVKTVKARVGPPISVATTRWMAAVDKPPDLIARWEVPTLDQTPHKKLVIMVSTMSPQGCKIDPRITPIAASEAIYAELHPECKHVLEELEA
jgi:hypothetical protein